MGRALPSGRRLLHVSRVPPAWIGRNQRLSFLSRKNGIIIAKLRGRYYADCVSNQN